MRQCSKPGCSGAAVASLTYNYQDSTAVLGPLSTTADPHAFDLCDNHAESLTVPRGWEVVRLQTEFEPAPPSPDDLLALVEAIRDAAGKPEAKHGSSDPYFEPEAPGAVLGAGTDASASHASHRRRSHLTVVTGDAEPQEADAAPGRPARGVFGVDD